MKTKNGYEELDLSERSSLRGRPPGRKIIDPVRKGIGNLMRELKAANTRWGHAVQFNEEGTGLDVVNYPTAEFVKMEFGMMAQQLEEIAENIEKRLKAGKRPSNGAGRAAAARKPVRKLSLKKRSAKKAAKAAETASA